MKVIDLLNKIANNDLDTPDYIEFFDRETSKANKMMVCEKNIIYYMDRDALFLNDEVEIIEEDNKDNFTGWKMYQDGKEVCSIGCSTNEEKEIPEKIIPTSLKGIDNLDEKIEIAHIDTISVIETVNQVIDYLKSKGVKYERWRNNIFI